MTPWPARETFDVLVVGKRLAVLLLAVAAYYVAVGFAMQTFQLRGIERVSVGSLVNTLINPLAQRRTSGVDADH